MIIPPTPGGALAKALKKACQEELKNSNISLSVHERGGKQLGHILGTTQPGASKIEHCRREKCFPCNTGQVGVCRRTGVGYKIVCIPCEAQISSEYAGESGRNLFHRGEEYVADVRKKSADKPLWKHIREKHDGRMEVEMFDHFRMELTGIFSSAQRRKANEGVRIAHLNPNTRMNSKDEFRQGPNIMMQPVRGVGV